MKRNKLIISIISLIFCISFATTGLSDENTMHRRPDYVPGEILVKFKDGALKSQKDFIHQTLGAVRVKEHKSISLERIKVPHGMIVEDAIDIYRQNPEVEYAEPNYILRATATPNDTDFNKLWGLHKADDIDIDAPEAWDIHTGDGNVIIAVVDTGIDYNHVDLSANIWSNGDEIIDGTDTDGNGKVDDIRGWDFVNNDNDPMDDDSDGHGTHVAGIIGAEGNNGIGISGVNWSIKLMSLKFLDNSGFGTVADAIDAISYAVDNGAKVINASYGYPENCAQIATPLSSERDAIEAAGNAGVLFVAAAGNAGCDNDSTPFYPASHDLSNIISVAATDHNDSLASFSNYGANSVDLGAPGVNILSTVPGGYESLNGTSMAAPHVSGVAGLILSCKNYTYVQVKDDIESSVDTLPSLTGNVRTNGRLNAYSALAADLSPCKPSNLESSVISGSEIDLSWMDNSSNENGFEIKRKEGTSGPYSLIDIIPADTTSYTDDDDVDSPVSEGTAYTYRIRAFNPIGFSSYSNEVSVTPFNVPTSLSAIVSSASRIDLSWEDNSSAEDGYKIERKTGSGAFNQIYDSLSADVTTYSDTDLTSGTTYTYRVSAYNSFGDSNYSNEASTTTLSSSGGGAASASGGGGGGGCFIATAAYGSYLDPHVEVLRKFRDDWLLADLELRILDYEAIITNIPGKAFVAFYYKTSPPVADYISQHQTLRIVTRWALTPLVYGVKYPVAAFFMICFGVILVFKSRYYKKSNA